MSHGSTKRSGAAKVARPRYFVARPRCYSNRVARPRYSGREKSPFRSFLIRLKARLLGNIKNGLGNLKYNLETF